MEVNTETKTETSDRRQEIENYIMEAAEKWPGDFLSRKDAVTFSGNTMSIGHLANLDSRGEGPDGAFYLGRKRVYAKMRFAKWMIRRMEV